MEKIDRWRGWSEALPEQATTSFVLFQLPPIPEVPPPLAGRMTRRTPRLDVETTPGPDAAGPLLKFVAALRTTAPVPVHSTSADSVCHVAPRRASVARRA